MRSISCLASKSDGISATVPKVRSWIREINREDGNGFVNVSASCRSVGTYFTQISFFSICSLVK